MPATTNNQITEAIRHNLTRIQQRIQNAAESCGRDPAAIRLVAVSKTVEADRVQRAIEAGVTTLGENYVQEARDKFKQLSAYPVSWHFIGHLQTNKAKYAVRLFDLIHTVDSLKLAEELNKRAQKLDKIQPVLVQVNIAEEASKSGTTAAAALDLIQAISALPNLNIRGLMTMPPYFNAPEKVRPFFKALRELRDRIQRQVPNVSLTELSMGMSGDFEAAITEGATMVRVGTAIFGERP